jgi:hypothetical protein
MRAAAVLVLVLAACSTYHESLAERLQGNWVCQHVYPDQGFTRTDHATLAVYRTTIQYTVNTAWECDSADACPGDPPVARGGYFEGIYTDLGDSLVLRDASDTVAFRSVTGSSFTFIVNGISFPMQRN